jgi:hypothetical protein
VGECDVDNVVLLILKDVAVDGSTFVVVLYLVLIVHDVFEVVPQHGTENLFFAVEVAVSWQVGQLKGEVAHGDGLVLEARGVFTLSFLQEEGEENEDEDTEEVNEDNDYAEICFLDFIRFVQLSDIDSDNFLPALGHGKHPRLNFVSWGIFDSSFGGQE